MKVTLLGDDRGYPEHGLLGISLSGLSGSLLVRFGYKRDKRDQDDEDRDQYQILSFHYLPPERPERDAYGIFKFKHRRDERVLLFLERNLRFRKRIGRVLKA